MIKYRVSTYTMRITETGEKKENFDVELFSSEGPIEARIEALKFAENFIEVLFESKSINQNELEVLGMSATSMKKDVVYYRIFIDWYTKKDIEDIKQLSEDVGEEVFPELERTIFILNEIDSTLFGPDFASLEKELKLYKKNGYSTNGLEVTYEAYDDTTEKMKEYDIIKTPFIYDKIVDFEAETNNKDYKPTSDLTETGQEEIEEITEKDILFFSKILTIGETKTTEFKSTLSYCNKTKQRSKDVEYAIVKTINAFMNHEGGILLIGITDKKEIIGLENDYSLFKGDNPKDELLKKLDNLIIHYLGKSSLSYISGKFYKIGQKDVLSIKIERSPVPVFIKSIKPKKAFDFYIRGNASSIPLNMKEAFYHIIKQWGYKKKD